MRRRTPPSPSTRSELTGVLAALAAAAVLTVAAMSGCAGDAAGGPSHTVTDSAGIPIVHSTRPAWTEGTAWRVEEEPRLEIGRVSGDDAYILDRVMGVTVLEDGGVAVAHMGDNTIRYYDADGTFVRAVGGQGGGPEEFQQVMGLERVGDEIWARQFSRYPLKIFDQRGNFVRAVVPDVPAGFSVVSARGVFGDGSILLSSWPQANRLTPEPRVATSTVLRQVGDRADTIAVVPAVRILPVPGRPTGVYQQLGPQMTMAVGESRFFHAFAEDYEIVVRDTAGEIRRVIRRDWEPRPITQDQIAAYAESRLNMPMEGGGEVPDRVRRARQAMVDAQVHPENHPAFNRIMLSRSGHVWTERPDRDQPKTAAGMHRLRGTPTTWDVFDPDGVWLGSVDLPARFFVLEAGEDYVAGVWKDEMDVEFVRVYGLAAGAEG